MVVVKNRINKAVERKFHTYPPAVKKKLEKIRKLILEVAQASNFDDVEETLKWGEPSYLVKGGSTVRFDWKPKKPDQYAIYFNCKTKLVDTFRVIYGDLFEFESNRAIVFGINSPLHEKALKHCIELSFKYHRLKKLPLLGA